ncbi:MAG TPA: AAA family ATPase [Candidatus Dormibacteraeota bacterium]|nr:AAA family ATPase [Candidatus Dormibacteraeota bacterium]
MAEAIIFTGLPGSGKTTYFADHFVGTHEYISRDVLGTAAREAALVHECIRNGRSFVVDNTNVTRAARAPFIRAAKAAGFQVHGYFFEIPTRTAIGRNNYRKDKKPIPVPAILRTWKLLEAPSLEEGFDRVQTIVFQPNSGREKEK